jgi:hypothetical protein
VDPDRELRRVERLTRIDRRFVDAVDAVIRPLTAWTGLDGGVFATILGVIGAALVTATTAVLVQHRAPSDLATVAVAVAAVGGLTAYDVATIIRQVRASRRAAADGLLVTDPYALRRLSWLALPVLVLVSLPAFAVLGLGVASVLVAAGYAAAPRCRPGGRRRRRPAASRWLVPARG